MKKLMIAALMLVSSSVAFAGDSEALSAILKSKSYAEAAALLKSSINQLADAQEKAKAYNKLVDLAMEKVSKEQNIITANQMATQFKQGNVQPYDTVGFYNAIYNALTNGLECEKYDQVPNAKGKVKAKFHKSNQARLTPLRLHMITAGQDAGNKEDANTALKDFDAYIVTGTSPLFVVDPANNKDEYLGEVARVAAIYAFKNKELDRADKYLDIAMNDPKVAKEALNLKLLIAQQQLKTKEDSLAYVNKLKDLYQKDKASDQIFQQLAGMYSSLKQTDNFNKLVEEKLASDPSNYMAWAMKGQYLMNAGKWDEAVEAFKKALEKKNDEPIIYTYIGFCLNTKAGALSDENAKVALFKEGLPYLEKAKELDPQRDKANWSYPLYQTYYILYGSDDPRTKELENMNK